MQIQENISLKPFNTFGIPVYARYFAPFANLLQLQEAYQFAMHHSLAVCILGGGSNILFTQDFNGLVLKNELAGIECIQEDSSHYYVRSAAGVNWHKLVMYCIENNYAGLENLALIPGNVGASPIQNIGAYGVELKEVFYTLEAYQIEKKKVVIFNLEACKFGYRDSIFKSKHKGKYVILSVTFKLDKTPRFNTSYGAITKELERMQVDECSIKAIAQAVINIRLSKLPNPAVIGNAGSFFKNPTIPEAQFTALQQSHPGMVGYPASNDMMKVAAGWLIEQCGWKGYRKGDAGCHKDQALVLVNYGHAQGIDIYTLSTEIMHSVETKFGILLEREVNVL